MDMKRRMPKIGTQIVLLKPICAEGITYPEGLVGVIYSKPLNRCLSGIWVYAKFMGKPVFLTKNEFDRCSEHGDKNDTKETD
jgi:hypothetical protein